jgi:hypothetical protein
MLHLRRYHHMVDSFQWVLLIFATVGFILQTLNYVICVLKHSTHVESKIFKGRQHGYVVNLKNSQQWVKVFNYQILKMYSSQMVLSSWGKV